MMGIGGIFLTAGPVLLGGGFLDGGVGFRLAGFFRPEAAADEGGRAVFGVGAGGNGLG
jgi:hypothetical protein